MNPLTTLYVNQADRERQIAEDLRNRQTLQAVEQAPAETPRPTTIHQAATTSPRASALKVRTAGR
jgi:hypothetical protein